MGTVPGIGGIAGTTVSTRGNAGPTVQITTPAFQPSDGITLNKSAARLAASATGPDAQVRQELLDEVRARLQEGAYQLQSALLKVAAHVQPYLE